MITKCLIFLCPILSVPSFDGQPDGLAAVLGLDNLHLQLVEPLARLQHLADDLITANEYATLRVLRRVAGVNADALEEPAEVGAAKEQGEPLLELRRVGDNYGVAAFRDGEGL